MRFSALEAVLPGRKLTNEEIVSEIMARNQDSLNARAQVQLARALYSLFALCGTEVRYVRTDRETAVDLTRTAGQAALNAAGMAPGEIDLLMFVGVGRGFLEPATANVFQDQLGLRRATCFDVLDACASWLRAVHIAHAFIRAREYNNIMILNGEFNFREYANFGFNAVEDLKHNFASFTIGEAATATILSSTNEDPEYYATFQTYGELRSLCMIPLPNIREFNGAAVPDHADSLRFFSHSRELFTLGIEKLVNHFRQDAAINQFVPDIAFGHAASDSASSLVAKACNAPASCYYYTHSRFGNTVSASVPLAMVEARKEGRLKDNDKVMIGIASAGLSTVWTRFRYISH